MIAPELRPQPGKILRARAQSARYNPPSESDSMFGLVFVGAGFVILAAITRAIRESKDSRS